MDVRAGLDDVAGLGPFFAVDTRPPTGPGWRPLVDLHGDPAVLQIRFAQVRAVLGDVDDRVVASITFQGLAARLLSPPVATAAVHGVAPLLDPESVRFRTSEQSPWPVSWPEPRGVPAPDPADAAALLAGSLVDGVLAPLVAAVRAQVPVAERLLWGNVASSAAAAARLAGEGRPAAAPRAGALAAHLLRTGPLAGTGDLRPAPGGRWTFRRRSCCLFYRVPGGGLCGDCGLDAVPGTGRPAARSTRP